MIITNIGKNPSPQNLENKTELFKGNVISNFVKKAFFNLISPFHKISKEDTLKCGKEPIEKPKNKENVRSEDTKDNLKTSLLKAVENNNLEMVKTLLKPCKLKSFLYFPLKIDSKNRSKLLTEILVFSIKNKKPSITEYLLQNFKEKIDVNLAAEKGNFEVVELLLKNDMIKEKKEEIKIPKNLSEAVKARNVKMVEKFLEEGNTDQREINKIFMEHQSRNLLSNEKDSKIHQLLWCYSDSFIK